MIGNIIFNIFTHFCNSIRSNTLDLNWQYSYWSELFMMFETWPLESVKFVLISCKCYWGCSIFFWWLHQWYWNIALSLGAVILGPLLLYQQRIHVRTMESFTRASCLVVNCKTQELQCQWWWWWWTCFCGMVDQPKAFSFIFSRDHYQTSSKSWISDTSRAVFEPAQNLTSGFVEWSSADNHSGDNHYTTGPQAFVQYKVHSWTRKTKTNYQFQTKNEGKDRSKNMHQKPTQQAWGYSSLPTNKEKQKRKTILSRAIC